MEGSENWGTVLSKLLIALFLVLAAVSAAWAGINGWKYMEEIEAVRADEARVKEIRKIAPTVRELAKQGITHDKLAEEMRTGNWTAFFDDTANAAGMNRSQYKLPRRETLRRPNYNEHFFRIGINHKSGVSRRSIARLLWTVESRRKYLKTRDLLLKRLTDEDEWGGDVIIAYREKR
ncbi:MAG: hypothetical protein ACYS47_10040 [Planctomycetota bacterium]|jgi:hypothetical protein